MLLYNHSKGITDRPKAGKENNMSYKYEVVAYINNIKVKRFIGNDVNELLEKFEKWFIKSPYDRNDLRLYKGEIQHAGY